MRKTNEKGVTMFETIMYISVIIVLGGILAGYMHKTLLRYRIGRAAQQIIDIKKAVISFTASDESYSNLSVAAMARGNSIPMDMKSTTPDTAQHALGGAIELGPVTGMFSDEGGDRKEDFKYMFYVTFKSLPPMACAEILEQGQFYGDGSDLDTLLVNPTNEEDCTENCDSYEYGWQFEHSYYPAAKITNNKVLVATSTNRTPNIHPSVAEVAEACSRKLNTITWIFS